MEEGWIHVDVGSTRTHLSPQYGEDDDFLTDRHAEARDRKRAKRGAPIDNRKSVWLLQRMMAKPRRSPRDTRR